jgi:hypothetical protein
MAGVGEDALPRQRPGISLPVEVTAITAILALALALMAGAGAALYQKSRPSSYISAGVLQINQPVVIANTPDGAPLQKLQILRYFYIGLLKTDAIGVPVAQQLGNVTPAQVEGAVSGLADPLTFTITIVATTGSPTMSNQIAQATISELTGYVDKSQQHIGVPQLNRVELIELTQPRTGIKVSVSTSKVLLPAVIAFLVVGGAFLIVADRLRRRW